MKKMIGLLVLAMSVSAHAGEKGHGGDVCDKGIDSIRKDVTAWINAGGSAGLDLSKKNFDLSEYNKRMLEVLNDTQVSVTCVKPKDKLVKGSELGESLYETSVDGKPKTCVGYTSDDKKPFIVCDLERFEKTDKYDQYWMIHHEFAGLAGLETADGATSDYEVSRQLSEFLEPVIELKLGIKKHNQGPSSEDFTISKTYDYLGNASWFQDYSNLIGNDPGYAIGNIAQRYEAAEVLESEVFRRDMKNIEVFNHVSCQISKALVGEAPWIEGNKVSVKLKCISNATNQFVFKSLEVILNYTVTMTDYNTRWHDVVIYLNVKRHSFKIQAK